MASRQSLKGGSSKIYEVINTFNKGYNTSIADDLIADNVFRDLINFLPSDEGNITKRPGINRTRLFDLFKSIKETEMPSDLTINISGSTNDSSISVANLKDIDYLYNNLFLLSDLTKVRTESIDGVNTTITSAYKPTSLANLSILEDYKLLDYLGKYDDLIKPNEYIDLYKSKANLSMIIIFLGDYKESAGPMTLLECKATRIFKLKIDLDYIASKRIMNISYEIRQPLRGNTSSRLAYRYDNDDTIDLAIYADNYYYMNGYDALVRINRDISSSTDIQQDSIRETYKNSSNIYKPTAIEIQNIGFNILASDPLSYVDTQGTADTIRGVFFTFNGEPTQVVPYNKAFNIHLLSSGSSTNEVPQYRPNNGETDTSINTYKNMPGSYNSDKSIFSCTGLNENGSFELKIKKGTSEYIGYFTMGPSETKIVGKIADVSSLVLSSKYCKVINNQLILYGNHGYLFYSDYNNFDYFPNYYYLYAAETENEHVVGLNYFRSYYALFTNKRIKRLLGAFGSDSFGLYPLNDSIGCTNPKTIKQVENYLYFLSYNGLYMLKQGYLGEGTENVEQIDLVIYKSYDADSMLKACVFQNYYGLYSKTDAILYNYVNDAYYKLKNAELETKDNSVSYSIPFQYNKLQNKLLYGIRVGDTFDICTQDYTEEEITKTDNGLTFVSKLETPYLSLGTPTNTKKFKEIYMKLYNKNGENVPLYVTIKVDDVTIISPSDYEIVYDNSTSTYFYREKNTSNKELKGYNTLGTITLGEDVLGERTLQILKMKIGAKGRSIKIIISDGIDQGERGYSIHQNEYRFDLATLGIVYKLKKVKEG